METPLINNAKNWQTCGNKNNNTICIIMKIESIHFASNLNNQCGNIPITALRELVDEFGILARFYMSAPDINNSMLANISDVITEMLQGRFKFVTLKSVAEAYSRGSLGELGGTTRFTIRNIFIWISAIEEKERTLFQQSQSKIDDKARAENERAFKMHQKNSSLYGMALYWKIGHCPMPDKTYDRLTLDLIVGMVNKGYKLRELTPSMIL